MRYLLYRITRTETAHFPLSSYRSAGQKYFKNECFFTLQFIYGYFIRNCLIAFPNDIYLVFS